MNLTVDRFLGWQKPTIRAREPVFVVLQGENPNKKSMRVKQKCLTRKCESRKKANQDPQNRRFSSVKKASNQLDKNQRKTSEKGCKTRKNRGHNIAL